MKEEETSSELESDRGETKLTDEKYGSRTNQIPNLIHVFQYHTSPASSLDWA